MFVVHIISGGDTGGAKTHVINLLGELKEKIDVMLVCFMEGDFSKEAIAAGIPTEIINTKNPVEGARRLKQLLSGKKVDIIHCHGARANLIGNMVKTALNAPIVTTVHSDYKLDYMGRSFANMTYGTINRLALRKIDYYIGVANTLSDMMIDRGFPPECIFTINNGIDFKNPIEHKTREAFFESIGFKVDSDDIVAGIAARLSPVKDIPTLLKAVKIVISKVPNFKLVIAGDGEDREKLVSMADELGLHNVVCFAGWLSDVASFYNAIDINLLTSVSEGFPYAIIEGIRMHCATISSRVGAVPLLLSSEKYGLLFTPGDEKELADYLIRYSTDKELRIASSDYLYERTKKLYSIEATVDTQLDIYKKILARENFLANKEHSRVVICGAYGHGNIGDSAILKSIIDSVAEINPSVPITVIARKPAEIKKTYHVDSIHSFNPFSMFNALRKSSLYINGGGTLIQNITSNRSLLYYLFTIKLAKNLGNLVYLYGCGIGPIIGEKNIKRVKKVLNSCSDTITLREPNSLELLQEYGIEKPDLSITCDPALVTKPLNAEESEQAISKHGIVKGKRYAAFILRTWYGFFEKAEEIAECADYLYNTHGLTPVFVSLNSTQDGRAAAFVKDHLKSPALFINEEIRAEEFVSLMTCMDLTISMRLHGLVFSFISGTPLLAISYDKKVNSFMEYIDCDYCVDLTDTNASQLIELSEKLLSKKSDRKENADYAANLALKNQQNTLALKKFIEAK